MNLCFIFFKYIVLFFYFSIFYLIYKYSTTKKQRNFKDLLFNYLNNFYDHIFNIKEASACILNKNNN